jgi:uncharacterized membrane protein YczE
MLIFIYAEFCYSVAIMSQLELLKRYGLFAVALLINSAGIALLTVSGLGTSQISSLPYALSFITPLSLGSATLAVNVVFVLAQVPLLGKEFGARGWLQLPVTAVFGVFIDVLMILARPFAPDAYALKLVFSVAGCLTLALGVSLEIVCAVTVLPGEGIVRAISRKTGAEFGRIKLIFDLALVASAIVLTLACLGWVAGVREGMVLAALCVGPITRLILPGLERALGPWFTRARAIARG